MKLVFKRVAVLALITLGLSGCSSNDENEATQPAELVDFAPVVSADEVWTRWAGDGAGTDSWLRLKPGIDGDSIFVCDADGDCYAYDRHTGDSLWSVDLDVPVSGGVGAGAGYLAVGTLDGLLIVLNSQDGSEVFRTQLTSEVLSSPAIEGNLLVVQAQNGHVFGFDLTTKEMKWQYDASLPLLSLRGTADPVISDSVTYAAFANGKVVALDNETGASRWERRVSVPSGKSDLEKLSDIDGTPIVKQDTMYAVGFNGFIRAIDLYSGRVRWQKEFSSWVGPAFGFGQVYLALDDGQLVALDDRSSSVNWKLEDLKNRRLTRPVTLGNYLVVGDFEGYLHFISQLSGTFAERIRIDRDGLLSPPVVVGDTLYIYSSDGTLAAVQIRNES
ncbi:outer membrane protein assembly factor BamB [Litoribrevibacter albus]|uniref:Outer membrane protein assembly factor BamB n=1 Tax=Litoribrevibacter albus TaxID=1473156 RepID=A0AA37W8I2_9GAMM|nr:outer membrane protein assembly factor BamB [Litoribrevibacter albus]GLQ32054.1 outer membrane protein assembly factor BamB [Litoribrevibacter albus]